MDHAKALADALRPIAALADGYEDSLTGDFIVGVALARLRDAQMALDAHPADALSRAPQPDTVTEEMVDAALKAYGNGWVSAADHRQHTFEPMKAAITAALNAKGK